MKSSPVSIEQYQTATAPSLVILQQRLHTTESYLVIIVHYVYIILDNVGWKDISSAVVNSCNEIMISRFERLKENPSVTRIRDDFSRVLHAHARSQI